MNIVIDRRVLANFRRRAWGRYPREYMEAMLGRREGETVYITLLYPWPHKATIWYCDYDPDEVERLNVEAERLQLEYIGGIHTHTGLKTCEHASKVDHLVGIEEGNHVDGILYLHRATNRSQSRLNFYIPSEPIKLTYA